MHPTTRVLIKTLNCDLDSSFIEGIGDAITLDDLWHYLTKYHEITEESDHVTRLDLKTISIYDILGDGYVKLESIRKVSKNLNNIIDRCDNFYERLPKVKRPKEAPQTIAKA